MDPAPDRVALRGDWPVLRLRSRFVAFTGRYTLEAEKAGYRRLETPVEVERGAVLRYSLRPLPGRLAIDTPGLAGAQVQVDGTLRGTTPLAAFEVEPGERALARARVGLRGAPRDARGRGARDAAVARRDARAAAHAAAGPAAPAAAGESWCCRRDPTGARVSLDGATAAQTPLELRLEPGRPHALRLSKPGHADAELSLTLRAGERREETLRLAPQLGEVRIAARPPDAELLVDGEPRGKADQTLQLLGRAARDRDPARGLPDRAPDGHAAARLPADAERRAQEPAAAPRGADAARGPEPGGPRAPPRSRAARIQMGAPRREPGRRANEPLRDVELARPFYVATREVSNAQFRRFEAAVRLGPRGRPEPRHRHPAGGARDLAAGGRLLQLAERSRAPAARLRRARRPARGRGPAHDRLPAADRGRVGAGRALPDAAGPAQVPLGTGAAGAAGRRQLRGRERPRAW